MNVRLSADFLSGLLFAVIGAAALFIARDYSFGTPARMGAGFFPILLSSSLVLVGAALMAKSLAVNDGAFGKVDPRPLLLLAGTVIFGLVIEDAGFIVAGILLVGIAHFAGRAFKPLQTGLFALVLVALCVLLFAYALGLPLPGTEIF